MESDQKTDIHKGSLWKVRVIAFYLDLFGDLTKMHGEVPFLVAIKLGIEISFGLRFFEVRVKNQHQT